MHQIITFSCTGLLFARYKSWSNCDKELQNYLQQYTDVIGINSINLHTNDAVNAIFVRCILFIMWITFYICTSKILITATIKLFKSMRLSSSN